MCVWGWIMGCVGYLVWLVVVWFGGGGGLGVCCSRYKFVGESNIKRNKWLLILVKYFIKKCEK